MFVSFESVAITKTHCTSKS